MRCTVQRPQKVLHNQKIRISGQLQGDSTQGHPGTVALEKSPISAELVIRKNNHFTGIWNRRCSCGNPVADLDVLEGFMQRGQRSISSGKNSDDRFMVSALSLSDASHLS